MTEKHPLHRSVEELNTREFDGFLKATGPYRYREVDGRMRVGVRLAPQHLNNSGDLHGGMAMTLADHALFLIARDHLEGPGSVTVSLTGDFTGSAQEGEYVEALGEVVHAARKLLFIEGRLMCGERTLMRFSGILKKRRQPAGDGP